MKRRKMKKEIDFIALSANEEYDKVIGGFVWIIFTDLPKDVFLKELGGKMAFLGGKIPKFLPPSYTLTNTFLGISYHVSKNGLCHPCHPKFLKIMNFLQKLYKNK